jgi:rod shape determining protein RodA
MGREDLVRPEVAAARRTWLDHVFSQGISWARFDWASLIVAGLLLGLGLTFLHAMQEADQRAGREGAVFDGQLAKLAVAGACLVCGMLVRPRWLSRNAWLVYGAALALLVAVVAFGAERQGAKRWLEIPGVPFDLQPSELAKVALVVALAKALERNRLRRLGDWLVPGLVALLPMGFVAQQPDLGSAMTFVPLVLGLCSLAGARGARIVALSLGLALALALAYRFELLRDYQSERIDTWLVGLSQEDLIANRNGAAFHLYHASTAIGNGGFFGTGLGQGVANQAAHLPERESDSIFAVIAEEGGFLGGGAVVLLYAFLVALLLSTAARLRDRFARFVVSGVALVFGGHLLIHAGVNLGLLPMTGVTLPLFSTGGSSLLASLLALGLALGHAAHAEPSLSEDSFRE